MSTQGKRLSIPIERRIVFEIIHACKSFPAFPVERWIDLEMLASARSHASVRISWVAIFLRAWGLASLDIPELRRAFVPLPWNYFYEHPHSVASVSVHRREPNSSADWLIFCKVVAPEEKTLVEIQQLLVRSQTGPIREVFRDGYRLAKLPWFLRRAAWTVMMKLSGRNRCKNIGTFSVSTLAGQNATNRFHPLVATTSFSYSPLNAQGQSMLTLLCDHRVLDGYRATEAIDRLEAHLRGSVLEELRALANADLRVA